MFCMIFRRSVLTRHQLCLCTAFALSSYGCRLVLVQPVEALQRFVTNLRVARCNRLIRFYDTRHQESSLIKGEFMPAFLIPEHVEINLRATGYIHPVLIDRFESAPVIGMRICLKIRDLKPLYGFVLEVSDQNPAVLCQIDRKTNAMVYRVIQ